MKKQVQQHVGEYIALCNILVAFTAAICLLWPYVFLVRVLILCLSCSYVAWGCITHIKTQRFTWKVAEEYIAVAFLGGMLLMLLTFSVR